MLWIVEVSNDEVCILIGWKAQFKSTWDTQHYKQVIVDEVHSDSNKVSQVYDCFWSM